MVTITVTKQSNLNVADNV